MPVANLAVAAALQEIADRLEIQGANALAAREGRLPVLVDVRDLRGDLHAHTNAADGRDTLEAMVAAAEAAGLEYVAITDHSRRQAMSHGLDGPALRRQARAIARVRKQATIDVLHGIGRGWLTRDDVLNARPVREMRAALRRSRNASATAVATAA